MQKATFPVKVYYADTDSGGVVYYANYLRWMEMGRCEFINKLGIDLSQQQRDGTILVVARVNATYQKPARLGDTLQLVVSVSEVTPLSFKFNYRFLRQEAEGTTTFLVEAQTLMVCVDSKDFRLVSVPRTMLPALEQCAMEEM